ncbi:hypothetical protein V2J09_009540 [Rumex salicifolius]
MQSFEQDQDYGSLWSSFLDIDSFFSPTSLCINNNQDGLCIYHDQYPGGYSFDDRHCSDIEHNNLNQEQDLEKFSKLAVEEQAEFLNAVEDQICTADAPSDWTTAQYTNYWPVHEVCEEAADDNEPSTSCSSPEISCEGEEYSQYLELKDGSAIDGELGKRLNQMIPVPHVPRTNGEIPSVDEATSDHQRLLDRLEVYDLVEHKVLGDGNCQFRALSDQFYRSPEHHKFVRQQVISQLKSNPEEYEGYVPMEYDEYLEKMSKCSEWGDHVTLQAAANSYGVKIFVITSFKDTCYMEILPKLQKSKRVIFLSFWAEVHYNSIYPQGGSRIFFYLA